MKHIFVSLAVIAIALMVWATFQKPWLGFTEKNEAIGSYRSFAGCKRDVEKRGGWCGKDCTQYGHGAIATCDPLVKVEVARP